MALVLLACGVALSAAASSAADVTGAPGGRAWHSVSAPATLLALSDYVMQPQPDDEGGGEEDTTNTDRPTFEKKDQPPANQPTGQQPATQSFPGGNQAPFETLGAPSSQSVPTGGTYSPPPPPGGKHRRGIIGLHPLALLVGLVALHIFVVTKVVK
jgi:hypothetical protein